LIEIPTDFTKFENLILSYYKANYNSIDIWQMRLLLGQNSGDMIRVDNCTKRSSLRNIDEDLKKTNVFKKTFINYLSLGYDARVGYGFDKNRSKSRCWNKFIYFWEGLKKNCCTKTASINNIIEKFEELDEEVEFFPKQKKNSENNILYEKDINIQFHKQNLRNDDSITTNSENRKKRNIIFCKKPDENERKIQLESDFHLFFIFKKFANNTKIFKIYLENKIFLKGNPVNLICQNINFYMGGTKDIWKKSENKIALNKNDNSFIHKVKSWNQSFNDGKLEFFSYVSGFDLGLEKIKSGNANKVHQGKGPFVITFKDMREIVKIIFNFQAP